MTLKIKLVHLGLLLCFAKTFCNTSNILPYSDAIDDLFSIVILLFFLIVIIRGKYSSRNLLGCILISTVVIYSAIISGYMIIATTVLMILAIREEPIDEIAAFLFKVKYPVIVFHTIAAVLLSVMGLLNIGGYYENGSRFRLHFGYGMPGHFADYVLDLIILWIWIHYTRIKPQDYIKLYVISILTYLCSNSRVVFANSMILVSLVWIVKHTNKIDWIIKKTTQFIVPLLTIFMLVNIYLFAQGNRVAYKIDDILNTRIRLNGYRIEQYGMTWFGQNCPMISDGMNWRWISTGGAFDCTYMWLIINMGAILLVILSIAFFVIPKQERTLVNLLLIIWALGALIDTDFLNGIRSFPILLTAILFQMNKDSAVKNRKRSNDDKILTEIE